ncbi:MAG: beta-galactosidase, partial [Prevotella sp.]|nr:beta-galactosidase [Prevotella sp.]
MKHILLITSMLTVALQMQADTRKVESLNMGWTFSYDSLFTNARQVDVPHDFQIEQPWIPPAADEKADNSDAAANIKSRLSARGFKEMGTGWYQRAFSVERLALKDKRYLLDFEGIMLVGDVYLNGQHVGGTDYGYVGFQIDVTNKLKEGDNELIVKASTMTEKNSRWYTGGGLFRNVSLITTAADLYLERHPLYITTRDNRFVTVSAELTNRTKSRKANISLKLYDPQGQLIYENTEEHQRITPSRTTVAKMKEVEIPNPQLWDTEHPNLYTAVVALLREDGSVADEVSEQFGIRTIEINPQYGLKLNGRKVLLQGYANHHTLGALGAAAYPRAIEKRLQLMKQFGMNHVRTSHNPYSRDFIRLCDQYGILVVDELYDKWTLQHTGGRAPFMNHFATDIEEWVKRDRNSPSVVLWSLGNELQQDPNQPFNDFGVTCYRMMKPVLQRYDSTRLVTVAMHPRYRNWQTDSLPCALAMETDIQAYNYRYMYFPGDGRRFPWMTFYQSEASTQAMGQNFFEMDLNRVIGLAYWGAIDYLGESMGWPAKGWAQGVFYISLEPKPKAYYMRSFFKPDEPVVHLAVLESEN